MNIAIFIHSKYTSTRVPAKNLQFIGNETLVGRAARKCVMTKEYFILDKIDVFVDSDNEIVSSILPSGVTFLLRPSELGTNKTDGNELLLWASAEKPNYQAYLQVNCCSPFLEVKTIVSCIRALKEGAQSVMTVKRFGEYLWDKGNPLFDIDHLPNGIDMVQYDMETHGVYGILRPILLSTKRRIDYNPTLVYVRGMFEDLDINTIEDLNKARLIHNVYKFEREY